MELTISNKEKLDEKLFIHESQVSKLVTETK